MDGVNTPDEIEACRRQWRLQKICLQDRHPGRQLTARRLEVRSREIDADDGAVGPTRSCSHEAPLRCRILHPGRAYPGRDQSADGPAKLRLGKFIEKPQFRRVVAGRVSPSKAPDEQSFRRLLAPTLRSARAARTTYMVAGRTAAAPPRRRMRRPCDSADQELPERPTAGRGRGSRGEMVGIGRIRPAA